MSSQLLFALQNLPQPILLSSPFSPHSFDQNKMHINPLLCCCDFSSQGLHLLYLDNSSSYVKWPSSSPIIPIPCCHLCLPPWPSSSLSTAPPLRHIEITDEGKCYFFSIEKEVIIWGSQLYLAYAKFKPNVGPMKNKIERGYRIVVRQLRKLSPL